MKNKSIRKLFPVTILLAAALLGACSKEHPDISLKETVTGTTNDISSTSDIDSTKTTNKSNRESNKGNSFA